MRFERALEQEERKVHLVRLRIAALYMAAPLVLSFSLIDYIYRPDLLLEFFFVRATIIPVVLVILYLLRNETFKKAYYIPGLILSLHLGIYSAYLTLRTGGQWSPYYAGINLAIIGGLSFLPWPRRILPIIAGAMTLPYFAMLALESDINIQATIPSVAFILSTIFLSVVSNELTRVLRRNEVTNREQLKLEIETKDQVIEDKTRHGVYLEKLAAQFSPQVIDAVKSGSLNLSAKSRQKIACIFIDIENSTGRSTRLDFNTYSTVISDFFSRCIDVLLEYDVTIGTYLGDGMLAFTNAPVEQDDYVERAILASSAVLTMLEKRKAYYSSLWRTEFNIRIGINDGYSLVGFFPNEKKGTYTAIGESVNLAARLCSRAPKDSICCLREMVTKNVDLVKSLEVARIGTARDIKGFEGENFELMSIQPRARKHSDDSHDQSCPLCDAPLSRADQIGDSVYFKCTNCSYTDLRPLDANALKTPA